MDASVTAAELRQSLQSPQPPLVIDVRRETAFRKSASLIAGALRRDPGQVVDWAGTLPGAARVAVYCVHGHEVSQAVQKALAARGIQAAFLEGGIEHWSADGGPVDAKPVDAATRWVTRERPRIDRIACPWLVRRFVDPGAEFLYVPSGDVLATARARQAVPFDVADVAFTHVGEQCSFDAFLKHYRLQDPALDALALIVRGADTGRMDLAPQVAGLAAISLGLSRLYASDPEMLEHGIVMYDALYRWCMEGRDAAHTWKAVGSPLDGK